MSEKYSNTSRINDHASLNDHINGLRGDGRSRADNDFESRSVDVSPLNKEAHRVPTDLVADDESKTHSAAALAAHHRAAHDQHESQKSKPLSLPIDADHVREKYARSQAGSPERGVTADNHHEPR